MNNSDYSKNIQDILKSAKKQALSSNHKYVDLCHLFYAMIINSESNICKILLSIGCNISEIKKQLNVDFFNKASNLSDYSSNHIPLSQNSDFILRQSIKEAHDLGYKKPDDRHLFLALIKEADKEIFNLLNSFSIDYNLIHSFIPKQSLKTNPKNQKKILFPTLELYSRDITEMAKNNFLDPVIGRTEEIDRLAQILSRRKKNNPVLIGEPGVGKTAIVEGLALRILEKKVPRLLWDYRIISLDIPGMLAGTKYRGQFEERMRKMMLEIEKSSNIILFIDELHTIVGAGSAAGSLDAANMFKPALARGDIQIVGATTLNEYRKYIESDGALDRRFQKIIVYQPSIKSTIDILNGIKDKYETHHKVKISKDAIKACVELSDRYINDRFLPDKAIDVMDEVCSRISLNSSFVPESVIKLEKILKQISQNKNDDIINQQFENAAKLRDEEKDILKKIKSINNKLKNTSEYNDIIEISDKDVADTVSIISGIPISKINERESVKILNIKDSVTKFIVGQDYAVEKLVSAIQRSRSGFKNPNHPIGSFMFLGPTGVGKTELAKQLAHSLFNKKESFIKIDMSEYMERYNISRLIGAPPGYVGYEEGGLLSEKVRRNPYSIVLFDEIEKAHTDVFNILLQILDEGKLTDSLGHVIDFSNTIIILTSNIGTQNISSSSIGFNKSDEKDLKTDLNLEVKKYFKPELLNRLDETIIFNSLNKENLFDIIDLQLNDLRKNLKSKNMSLRISKSAKNILLINGTHREWGARPIRRTIQDEIENVISFKYLNGEIKENSIIYINGKGSQLIFKSKCSKEKTKSKSF